ncbi:MAG: glycosyltransferase family 4 protein [Candidatus Wallbacteria bacterium]
MKKKILIVGPHNSEGGVSNYYNNILPCLKNNEKYDIDYLSIGNITTKINSLRLITAPMDQLRYNYSLFNQKYNLIHVNPSFDLRSFLRDGLFILAAKRNKIPVIAFFRAWEKNFEKSLEKNWKWFFNLTYKKVDAFIVLSDETRQKLNSWNISVPIFKETTTVNEEFLKGFNINEKVSNINKDEKIRILFLSRIEKEKGIFEFLEGLKIFKNKLSKNKITLTIAGNGTALNSAKKYVKKELSDIEVYFPGYITGSEKIKALKENYIYCLPSYAEGMPNSLLEAITFGLCSVVTPVGGIKDFFENEKMGYLIKENNPKCIAENLFNAIKDKENLINIIKYNHEYGKNKFLSSNVASRLISIYEKFII